MQGQSFSQKDWTLFRNKIAGWQEAYMARLNNEYIQLLQGDGNPSDKFWSLEKRIRRDTQRAGVRLEMTRSTMITSILSLICDGAICLEDLEEFSDELQERARAFVELCE